ncbi:MAG: M48 family metalloprotease [Armatimonadota bacterium]
MHAKNIRITGFLLLVLAVCTLPALAGGKFDEETKIGKEESDRFAADKSTKFVEDAALTARIETIVKAIADVAREREIPATYGNSAVAPFEYTFKIVDDKEVNAFSLPGGFIYINKGLIDCVQSDDELAAVIAHEIAHIAHHHAMQLIASQQKEMAWIAGGLLVGVLSGAKGADLSNLAYMGNLISIAKMSAYGQKAEFDADRAAVCYLAQTKYKPIAMLTFMERLARDDMRKPEVTYGIFATHPPSYLRSREIIDEIEKHGLTVDAGTRREVTNYMRVQVKPVDGTSAVEVWIADTKVITVAEPVSAEYIASEFRRTLLDGAKIYDVKASGGKVSMLDAVIEPSPEDAKLAGSTVEQLASAVAARIQLALMKERLHQGF